MSSVDGRMDKENVVYAYNGVSFILKHEVLTLATTWTSLEDMTLRDISLAQKDEYSVIALGGGTWMVVMVAQQGECSSCHSPVHLQVVTMVNFVLCVFYHD